MVFIIIYLIFPGDSLTSYRFTTRTEELNMCEPLQMLGVRISFQCVTSVVVLQ